LPALEAINCEETHVETDPFLLLSRQYYDGSAIFIKKAISKLNDLTNLYLLIKYKAYDVNLYTESQELFFLESEVSFHATQEKESKELLVEQLEEEKDLPSLEAIEIFLKMSSVSSLVIY
jgi:hypothetical protein